MNERPERTKVWCLREGDGPELTPEWWKLSTDERVFEYGGAMVYRDEEEGLNALVRELALLSWAIQHQLEGIIVRLAAIDANK